jgi:hypothetical protein
MGHPFYAPLCHFEERAFRAAKDLDVNPTLLGERRSSRTTRGTCVFFRHPERSEGPAFSAAFAVPSHVLRAGGRSFSSDM